MKNLLILMLLISFGSIGAVFFTPGLPEIAQFHWGTLLLLTALLWWPENPLSLFVPMVVIYLGPGFIFANALNLGLEKTADKSNGSAMISFLNMGSSCVWVLILGNITIYHVTFLPMLFIILVALGVTWYSWLKRS